jgi:hypothetical protein
MIDKLHSQTEPDKRRCFLQLVHSMFLFEGRHASGIRQDTPACADDLLNLIAEVYT